MKSKHLNPYQRYAKELLRFETHLLVFICTVLMLSIVQWIEGGQLASGWLAITTISWGILLMIHYLVTRWKRSRAAKRRG
ncbi:MAG: 2TM domain-containing protein [Sphingobacteriales bacterium]|nr:MAG: 2TM domain-containing protein [Sphingobacteriales bacterium]